MSAPEQRRLQEALGIPGARAVSLLDPDGPTVLWWAGAGPPDEQEATAVVALAASAAGLVMLSEPGDELGDVLLTSGDAFHVVRLVEDESLRVAHLTLRRAGANLAMARQQFRTLLDAYAKNRLPEPEPQPELLPQPELEPQPQRMLRPVPPGEVLPARVALPESLDADDVVVPLPRRSRQEPPPAADGKVSTEADDLWFSLLGQEYRTDDGALGQILSSLRDL